MSEQKHSPTPWRESVRNNRISLVDASGFLLAEFYGPDATDDRALVVRAVNSHEDLLAACKAAKRLMATLPLDGEGEEVYELLRDAIKKAEAAP